MCEWTVATSCSIELSEFARRQNVMIQVDADAATAALDQLGAAAIGGTSVLLEACLVEDGLTGLCKPGSTNEKLGYAEAVPDYHVRVAVAERSKIRDLPPVARDLPDIIETSVHEFQHVVDGVNEPELVVQRTIEQLDIVEQGINQLDRAMKSSLPIIGERTAAFVDAYNNAPNGVYRAILVALLLLKTSKPALEEKARLNHYYWNGDPMEKRARAAQARAGEIIPSAERSAVRIVKLAGR